MYTPIHTIKQYTAVEGIGQNFLEMIKYVWKLLSLTWRAGSGGTQLKRLRFSAIASPMKHWIWASAPGLSAIILLKISTSSSGETRSRVSLDSKNTRWWLVTTQFLKVILIIRELLREYIQKGIYSEVKQISELTTSQEGSRGHRKHTRYHP